MNNIYVKICIYKTDIICRNMEIERLHQQTMGKANRFNIKTITAAKTRYFVFLYGGEADMRLQPP